MFAQLLASRPVRQRQTAGLGASVALHALLFAGAVAATVGTQAVHSSFTTADLVYTPPSVSEPRPAAPVAERRVAENWRVPTINVPIDVPTSLPPIRDPLRAWREPDASTRFVPGGVSASASSASSAVPDGGTWLADQVEVPATLETTSPIPRFPAILRSAGLEGSVRFQFVVDTLGRVELATVRELASTHPAFALAVRAALPRMRFAPARVGGRPVRQLVEFPILFRMER